MSFVNPGAPKKKNPLHSSEAAEQRTVIDWCRRKIREYPELAWMFHVPNVRSDGRQARDLAREGVLAGVADLVLLAPRAGYLGLLIEMKAEFGSLWQTQRSFLEAAAAEGYLACVCWNADQAIKLLEWYLSSEEILPEPVPDYT